MKNTRMESLIVTEITQLKNALDDGEGFGGFWANLEGCWAATHTRPSRSLG